MSNESEINEKKEEIREIKRKIRKLKEKKEKYKKMKKSLGKIADKLKSAKSNLNEGISIFKTNYISNSEIYKSKEVDIDTNYTILCNIYDNIEQDILPECDRQIEIIKEKIEDLEDEIDDLEDEIDDLKESDD